MTVPDVLNPLDALFGRLWHGPMQRIAFSTETGITGVEVEHLLRQYGVRIWGRELDNPHELAFQVTKSQAIWAEYVLCRAGIPLTTPLLDPRNAGYPAQHSKGSMPTPWDSQGIGAHSLVDHVVDWLAKLG